MNKMDNKAIRRLNLWVLALEANNGKERGAIPALAKRTGTSTNYLYQCRLGKERDIGDDLARQLEVGMNKPKGWMDHLHGRKAIPTFTQSLPLFDLPMVLSACKEPSAFLQLKKAAEGTFLTDRNTSERAFAMRVEGDAMQSSHGGGPTFPIGVRILVDPGIKARPGAFVVARVKDDIYFRKLSADGKRLSLIALNQSYPHIDLDDDCEICGVVVEYSSDVPLP